MFFTPTDYFPPVSTATPSHSSALHTLETQPIQQPLPPKLPTDPRAEVNREESAVVDRDTYSQWNSRRSSEGDKMMEVQSQRESSSFSSQARDRFAKEDSYDDPIAAEASTGSPMELTHDQYHQLATLSTSTHPLPPSSSSSSFSILTPTATAKGDRIIYNFLYQNNALQQTESRSDMRCPWCSLLCGQLYSLLKHMSLCHPRFLFTYTVRTIHTSFTLS